MPVTQLFQQILCPVDFSEHSRQALASAALLTSRRKGRLTVIFVEHPLLMAAAAAGYDEKAILEKGRKELSRFVERTVGPYGLPKSSVTVEAVFGEPHEQITALAQRLKADLVVMGAHGYTGANKLMLGSTTHRLLRKLPIPILATPPVKGRPKPLPRGWPGKRALAPVDLGTRDKVDAEMAAIAARELDIALELIHVIEPVIQPRWIEVDAERRAFQLQRQALDRLESMSRSLDWGVAGFRVESGMPADVIAATARKKKVGLVIMTRRQAEGLFGPRQGAISYQVLCEAKIPVLALPSDEAWVTHALAFKPASRRP
jgi:nucleotide-binding universal stress UspA family protein